MKIDKSIINQIINVKNKKRKTIKINCKNRVKSVKIGISNIKTTNIDQNIVFLFSNGTDLFPMLPIIKNKQVLIDLSNYLSKKINSQITKFKSVKGHTIIEYIAKYCTIECLKDNNTQIIKYLKSNFLLDALYKKELQFLPYLLLNNLLSCLSEIANNVNDMYTDICVGASQNNFLFSSKYSVARVYGIAKYNKNLLKFINISNINIKKCIFNFINKLVVYYKKINIIFKIANNLIKYTTFSGGAFCI